jgi:hypothetical protein
MPRRIDHDRFEGLTMGNVGNGWLFSAEFFRISCGIFPHVIADCSLINPEHLRRLPPAQALTTFGYWFRELLV